MNLRDALRVVPYASTWHLRTLVPRVPEVVFYCTDPLDWAMWKPIRRHLPIDVPVAARSANTLSFLDRQQVRYLRTPVFPRAVIMARHLAHHFPVKRIVKIGFDHGLYQFKRWTAAKNYNAFATYLMSSAAQVDEASRRGVRTAKAIGYPKLDALFDGTFGDHYRNSLRSLLGLDPRKPTVMLSTTWDVAGMSALDRWIDRAGELADELNVLTTAHTWTAPAKVERLRRARGTLHLEDQDVTPYFSITDVLVGDSNSLLGEFCALDKPIVTWRVPDGDRTIPEIKRLIASISTRQIDSFDELRGALRHALANPREKSVERRAANAIMHGPLDGRAGARAAGAIMEALRPVLS